MKIMLQIAAALTFGFCFAGGFWSLVVLGLNTSSDAAPIAALGLVLMGLVFFAGSIIWLFAEKCCGRRDDKGGRCENNPR